MANSDPKNQFQAGHTKKGGRPKGGRNKRTVAREEAYKGSMSSLEFFRRMRDGETFKLSDGSDYVPTMEDRKWAAKEAAPYEHPRLSAIRTTDGSKKTHEEWLEDLADGGSDESHGSATSVH